MNAIPHVSQEKSTCHHGENKEPCSFHIKCYENWYLAKHGKQVAGEMSMIHRCPECAKPKFKRKVGGGRGQEEESVADAEGGKKKAKNL